MQWVIDHIHASRDLASLFKCDLPLVLGSDTLNPVAIYISQATNRDCSAYQYGECDIGGVIYGLSDRVQAYLKGFHAS